MIKIITTYFHANPKISFLLIGIDLFSGAGGMTTGAKLSGIAVRYAVEIDKFASETYKHNNQEVTVFNSDIKKISSQVFGRHRDLVVFGGPPCQGFSVSNSKTRNKANPKNWLYQQFFRLSRELEPSWIVIENVTGIKETEGGSF